MKIIIDLDKVETKVFKTVQKAVTGAFNIIAYTSLADLIVLSRSVIKRSLINPKAKKMMLSSNKVIKSYFDHMFD